MLVSQLMQKIHDYFLIRTVGEKKNPNSDFSIKSELAPSFRDLHSEELTKAEEFSLAEDNKHSNHMLPGPTGQTYILIRIKLLRHSLRIKSIDNYSSGSN